MARTAGRRKASPPPPPPRGIWRGGAAAAGSLIARNPVTVGGITAFLVSLSYVSANALFYQPHFHQHAFFSTRDASGYAPPRAADADVAATQTRILIERDAPTPAVAVSRPAASDPQVERVQRVLTDLKFYSGTVDGVSGPRTKQAIADYQRTVGLQPTGEVNAELMANLGAAGRTGATQARPTPKPTQTAPALAPVPAPAGPPDNIRIQRIQAGLKAFGHDGIEPDGVVGVRTKNAIREFQSLFGLPVTGEPDVALYRKMREIGLAD